MISVSSEKVGFDPDLLYSEFFVLQDSLTVQKKHLSLLHKQMVDVVDNYNLSKNAIDELVKQEREELMRNNKSYSGLSNTNVILSIIKQPTRSSRLPKVGISPKLKIVFKVLHKSKGSKSRQTYNLSTDITRFFFDNRIAHFRLVDIMRASGVKVTDHLIPTLNFFIKNVNDLNLRYQAIYDNYLKTELDYKIIADYLKSQDEDNDNGS
jgi:hypothetical protein